MIKEELSVEKGVSPLLAHIASPKSCAWATPLGAAQPCSQPAVCQVAPLVLHKPISALQWWPSPWSCTKQIPEDHWRPISMKSGRWGPPSALSPVPWPALHRAMQQGCAWALVIMACGRKKPLSSLTQHSHWHQQHHKSCQGFPVWHWNHTYYLWIPLFKIRWLQIRKYMSLNLKVQRGVINMLSHSSMWPE